GVVFRIRPHALHAVVAYLIGIEIAAIAISAFVADLVFVQHAFFLFRHGFLLTGLPAPIVFLTIIQQFDLLSMFMNESFQSR
ncbi:MAG: hypothetical protein Q4E13_13935, partial [Clostridia bacterium]|nr:hypothetical protein [Clostridia bacterium]